MSAPVGHQQHQSQSNQSLPIQLATVSSFSMRIQVKSFLSFSTMSLLDNYTANKSKKSKETVRSEAAVFCSDLPVSHLHSFSFFFNKERERMQGSEFKN